LSGYYREGDSCLPCHPACSNCSDGTTDGCESCGYLAELLIETDDEGNETKTCYCERGFYNDDLSACSHCDGNCYRCTAFEESTCIACNPGFIFENGICNDCSDPEYNSDQCPPPRQMKFATNGFGEDDTLIYLEIYPKLPDDYPTLFIIELF
jgi:hypothetical protein